jgi:hypothetical protein
MAATLEAKTNCADIRTLVLGAHADADFAVIQFFEKDRDDDSLDGAQVIDQAFVVFGDNAESVCRRDRKAEACDFAAGVETHTIEQNAQQLDAAARIALVKLLAQAADVDPATQDISRDLKGARGRLRILKRTGVGRDGGEKIFCNRFVERQFLALQELKKNLPGGRGSRVDVVQVAIALAW